MTAMSRREFVKQAATDAALAGFLASGAADLRANPLGMPIGSQTWPHRQLIKDGKFATLATTLAEMGVQSVEMCSPLGYPEFASLTDGKRVRDVLADHGLKCESGHFGMKELRARQSESIAWAHDVGITQMITASLGGGSHPTMDDVKRAADEYNRIALIATNAGIQQGLHNEGFELSIVDGERTYDVLMRLLDPALVKFQFQMSAISLGFVAHEYFIKYPGRFISMHLQDVDLNAAPPAPLNASGNAGLPGGGRQGGGNDGPRGVSCAVGKGSIDWVRTFAAAKTGGVKNYFVEQSMDLTRESVAFLKRFKV